MLKNRARGRALKTSPLSKNRAAQARARRDKCSQEHWRGQKQGAFETKLKKIAKAKPSQLQAS
jgi:hypothetical protein